jgi:hypothetical protein
MKTYSSWLFIISFLIFALTVVSFNHLGYAQMQRDENMSKEVEKINPATPVKDATKKVLDNTVHKILPIEIPTQSKLVEDEKSCYRACNASKDENLKAATDQFARGHAWSEYRSCKEDCPKKAAAISNEALGDGFSKDRYPAGSAIPNR